MTPDRHASRANGQSSVIGEAGIEAIRDASPAFQQLHIARSHLTALHTRCKAH